MQLSGYTLAFGRRLVCACNVLTFRGVLWAAFPDLGLAYSISLEATDNKTELDGLF